MSEERLQCYRGCMRSVGSILKDLEKKYTINIDAKDKLFYVYNMFGGLMFIADSIEHIEKEMNRIYKIRRKLEVADERRFNKR